VSVVATGIEPGSVSEAPRSTSSVMSGSRAPKRPVLELSGEADEGDDEAPLTLTPPESVAPSPLTAPPAPEATAPRIPAIPDPVSDAISADDDVEDIDGHSDDGDSQDEVELFGDASDSDEDDSAERASESGEAFDLTGMQEGDSMGEEGDDVDGIVDPLAGLRGADDEDGYAEPGEDGRFGVGEAALSGGALSAAELSAPELSEGAEPVEEEAATLDLDDEVAEYEELSEDSDSASADPAVQDDLLADADRLAAANQPVEPVQSGGRRRGILGAGADSDAADNSDAGGEGDAAAAAKSGGKSGGSTLFERMANLSRSSSSDDDDEDGDDAPALSIPRFLGRQNNQ